MQPKNSLLRTVQAACRRSAMGLKLGLSLTAALAVPGAGQVAESTGNAATPAQSKSWLMLPNDSIHDVDCPGGRQGPQMTERAYLKTATFPRDTSGIYAVRATEEEDRAVSDCVYSEVARLHFTPKPPHPWMQGGGSITCGRASDQESTVLLLNGKQVGDRATALDFLARRTLAAAGGGGLSRVNREGVVTYCAERGLLAGLPNEQRPHHQPRRGLGGRQP